ncbi:MAG TPA: nucleotidyl transferase AbiEii/AbiGii toxin family protein [Streptosporangiaceae bacterium]|nr:nucleotidyl transferase AbiEii/AbiGii toxin family protein [Streptosporangiaceae bacterium]
MSPRRDSPAGRAYLDLQALARRAGRPAQEYLVMYVHERFLFRLARSRHRHRMVLKGGMLLAALDTRRPTADIDLLATGLRNDVDSVAAAVREVLDIEADDGVVFSSDRLTARVIRDAELYAGVRLAVPAMVDRARTVLRADVNVGDPVTPAPVEIEYPGLLAGSFRLLGYPLASVLAEKIITMIDRGEATTRERDFADVVLLTRRHRVSAAELAAALRATAAHRQSTLRPLAVLAGRLGPASQQAWSVYLDRNGLASQLPASYAEAITAVAEFADPLLTGTAGVAMWDPVARTWAVEGHS